MDPNEALRQLRGVMSDLENMTDATDWLALVNDATYLFGCLDHWLVSGGFLPKAWEANR